MHDYLGADISIEDVIKDTHPAGKHFECCAMLGSTRLLAERNCVVECLMV